MLHIWSTCASRPKPSTNFKNFLKVYFHNSNTKVKKKKKNKNKTKKLLSKLPST